MEAEFLHEMFGLSIDHYVAVVAVEVGCHIVHRAVKRSRAVAGKVRQRRLAKRKEGGSANERAGPTPYRGHPLGGRASDGEEVGRPIGRPFCSCPALSYLRGVRLAMIALSRKITAPPPLGYCLA